jgi:tetratricopeptide (TPR) repeat protein
MRKTTLISIAIVAAAGAGFLLRDPAPGSARVPVDVAPAMALEVRGSVDRFPSFRSESAEVIRTRRRIANAVIDHEFERVIELVGSLRARQSQDLWARALLSDAYVEMGRYEEAEDVVQQMLEIKPCGASYFRGAALMNLHGETERAVETLRLAYRCVDPEDTVARAWALSECGSLLWNLGEFDDARREFEKALRIRPDFPGAMKGLGRLAAARGEISEAIRWLARSADTPTTLSELSFLYGKSGDADRAEESIDRAIEMGEREPTWARSVALCLADHRIDPERAVELARRETQSRPGIHSWDALAWALCAAGRFSEAMDCSDKALALGTRDPMLLFHAGKAAEGCGRRSEAVARFETALGLNPKFHPAFADEARAALARLK